MTPIRLLYTVKKDNLKTCKRHHADIPCALERLKRMLLDPNSDIVDLSQLISTWHRQGHWEKSLQLFGEVGLRRLRANVTSLGFYNIAWAS